MNKISVHAIALNLVRGIFLLLLFSLAFYKGFTVHAEGETGNPAFLSNTNSYYNFNEDGTEGTIYFIAAMETGGSCEVDINTTGEGGYSYQIHNFDTDSSYTSEVSSSDIGNGTFLGFTADNNTNYYFTVTLEGGNEGIPSFNIAISGEGCVASSSLVGGASVISDNMVTEVYGGGSGDPTYPGDPRTISFTTQDVQGSLLVASISYNDGSPWGVAATQFSTVTYNGQPLYRGCQAAYSDAGSEIWYLPNPPVGTYDFYAESTWPNQPAVVIYSIYQVSGIDVSQIGSQTYADNNTYCVGGESNTASVTLTGASAGDLIVGAIGNGHGAWQNLTSQGNLVDLFANANLGNNWFNASGAYQTASGGDVISWGIDSSDIYALSAMSFPALVSEPSPSPSSSPTPTPTATPVPDTTDPEISFTSSESGYTGSSITITGTATDTESSIDRVTIHGLNNGGGVVIDSFNASPVDGVFDSQSESFTAEVSGLNGYYWIYVTAYDTEGNSRQYTYADGLLVDSSGPEISANNLGLAPSVDTTPTYNVDITDNESGSSSLQMIFCNTPQIPTYGSFDEDCVTDWQTATITSGSVGDNSISFTMTPSTELSDGVRYVYAKATDLVGNETIYVIDRITIEAVDTAEPIVQLYDMVPDPTTDKTPIVQGKIKDDTDQLTSNITNIWYSLDSGNWQSVLPLDGSFDSSTEFFSIQLPELDYGSHTVLIRARDAAGNQTNDIDNSLSVSFTVEAPDPNETSTLLTKSEEFIAHDDHDLISGQNYIWGNSILRLSEVMSPTMSLIDDSDYGPRYGSAPWSFSIDASDAGGFWVNKYDGTFSYFDSNNTETNYDIFAAPINYPLVDGISSQRVHEVKEVVVNGNYYLWILAWTGVIGLDFGSNPSNGIQDVTIYQPDQVSHMDTWAVDTRNSEIGFYIGYTDESGNGNNGFLYYKPNAFSNSSDDTELRFNVNDGIAANDVINIFLDTDTNYAWVSSYGEGVTVLDDNGSPTFKDDDNTTVYDDVAYSAMFAIGKDDENYIYMGGNGGMYVITDNNGTFSAADDTVVQQITSAQLGFNTIYRIIHHPGEYPVGSQFFLTNETGDLKYLNLNDTYTDLNDDQLISMNIVNDLYPAVVDALYQLDYSTLRAVVKRHGIYDISLNRDYAESGYAETLTDARIEGRLDVDFITLSDVEVLVEAGEVSYHVSNDGGVNWYDIAIGETVNFPTSDYRIKLRINMEHGSTPVLGGYDMNYYAYEESSSRGTNLSFSSVPARVTPGTDFSFTINALDDLNNAVDEDVGVSIELRRISDNTTVSSFVPTSATISGGSVTVTGNANVSGDYRLYVTGGGDAAFSSPIVFANPESQISSGSSWIEPEINLLVSESTLSGPSDVTLTWSGQQLSGVELWSEYENYGQQDISASKTFYVDKDTTFVAKGISPYGDVLASVSVDIVGEEGGQEISDELFQEKPVINEFSVEASPDDPTLITIIWDVDGADVVEIAPIGVVADQGSQTIRIHQETKFEIIANNQHGDTKDSKTISPDTQEAQERQSEIEEIQKNLAKDQGDKRFGFLGSLWFWFIVLIIILFIFFMFFVFRRREREEKNKDKSTYNIK